MTIRLAVFDIDGTLVDSRASILEAAQEAALAVGIAPPPFERVRRGVGLSLLPALALMAPDLDAPSLERFAEAYRQAFRRMHETPGFAEPLYEGVAELLTALKADGWVLSLATGQSRRGLHRNLARPGWASLFNSAHCAEDGPGKPDPAMLNAAMAAAGSAPGRTIMIGDTAHDHRMAINARAYPLGVSWGFHSWNEQRAGGAVQIVDSVACLEQALEAFGSGATGPGGVEPFGAPR